MTQKRADILIIVVYIAWGMSYFFMKLGLKELDPFNLIALRFGIAFFVTAALFAGRMRRTDPGTAGRGAVLGLLLFGIFTCLFYGLRTTTASSAGFLTSTTVVIVPLLLSLAARRMPKPFAVAGMLTALAGIALLAGENAEAARLTGNALTLEPGSLLCLCGAFLYAVHILLTDRFARTSDALRLGILQLGFAGLFGLVFSLLFEKPALPSGLPQWATVMGLALVCSAFGFVGQTVAQKYTTPERTAVFYALEPVSSTFFGFLFLHEAFGPKDYIGAALVLCSVFVSNIRPAKAERITVSS